MEDDEPEKQPGKNRESEVIESFDNENVSLRFNGDQSTRNLPLEIDELHRNEGFPRRKYVTVDVKRTTKLALELNNEPNTVLFEVSNNYPFDIEILLSPVSPHFYIGPFINYR